MLLKDLANLTVAEHPVDAQRLGAVHFKRAILKVDLLGSLVFDVLEFGQLQAVTHRLFPEFVLADHAQRHVQPMTGGVIEEIQPLRIIGKAVPVDVIWGWACRRFLRSPSCGPEA